MQAIQSMFEVRALLKPINLIWMLELTLFSFSYLSFGLSLILFFVPLSFSLFFCVCAYLVRIMQQIFETILIRDVDPHDRYSFDELITNILLLDQSNNRLSILLRILLMFKCNTNDVQVYL